MSGFTPFLRQLFAFHLSTLLDLGYPPSSLTPLPLAFVRSFFGRLCFLLTLTSGSTATLKTPSSSSLLSSCLYYVTSFAVANLSTVSFNPSTSICSSVVFLSTTFQPHLALTIALSVFLEIAFPFLF